MHNGDRIKSLTIAAALIASDLGVAAQTPTLDLTQRPASVDPSERRIKDGVVAGTPQTVAGGTAGQTTVVASPLIVTLRIDEQVQRWQSPFFYEIELQNASTAPVMVPWSTLTAPPPADIKAARTAGYRRLTVSLVVKVGDDLLLLDDTAEQIVGYRGQPETVRTLEPGERVIVRGKGRWSVLSWPATASRLAAQFPRELTVQAIVSLSDTPATPGPAASSIPTTMLMQGR